MLKMLQDEHFKNRQAEEYKVVDPRLNAMARINTSIGDILTTEQGLTEETKANVVANQLGKFLHLKNRSQYPHETAWGRHMENGEGEEKHEGDIEKGLSAHTIVKTVPGSFRRKAERLTEFLKSSGRISWSDSGRLLVNGKEIENTNIVDLVNDALRQRKKFAPPGWEIFARELRRMNAPQELVGNAKYRTNVPSRQRNVQSATSSSEFAAPRGSDEEYDVRWEKSINV